jgi:ABC-type uncharacterized transport system YnjBCD permease subunit
MIEYLIVAFGFALATQVTIYNKAWKKSKKRKMGIPEALGASWWTIIITAVFPLMLVSYLILGHDRLYNTVYTALEKSE